VVENYPHGKMKKSYLGANGDMFHEVKEPTPDKLTALGMARTFQNIRLWKSMTVFDNILIAKHMKRSSNLFSAAFRLNSAEEERHRAAVMDLLRVVGLEDEKDDLATSLPYGKQRRLEIARALATEPTGVFTADYRLRHFLPMLSTVSTAVRRLVADSQIDSVDGTYRLIDPLFANHLRRTPNLFHHAIAVT
jgi:ABC-type arginine transport system ATPase subunit